MALRSTIAGVLAGLTLLVAACGDDETTSSTATRSTAGTGVGTGRRRRRRRRDRIDGQSDVGRPAGEVPARIVSLAATHTETLFAIGAGDQVVAVDDQSNYPAEAVEVQTDLSGYTPNVESSPATSRISW